VKLPSNLALRVTVGKRRLPITSVAFAASLALHAFAQGGALTPAQQQLRAIYQELVEINTTDSAGSCTAAAEAMAARLKAGGLPAQGTATICA